MFIKNLLSLTLVVSFLSAQADDLTRAITRSDYPAVERALENRILTEAEKALALTLASDIAAHKSNSFGSDWLKASLSKKLFMGFIIPSICYHLECEIYDFLRLIKIECFSPRQIFRCSKMASLLFYALAIRDAKKNYDVLQDKFLEAEQIKLLLMAQQTQF